MEAYKESTVGVLIFDNLLFSIPIVFLIFIGLSLIVGRLDTVFGLREEELRNSSTSNPVMRKILTGMKDIQKELLELKEIKSPEENK